MADFFPSIIPINGGGTRALPRVGTTMVANFNNLIRTKLAVDQAEERRITNLTGIADEVYGRNWVNPEAKAEFERLAREDGISYEVLDDPNIGTSKGFRNAMMKFKRFNARPEVQDLIKSDVVYGKKLENMFQLAQKMSPVNRDIMFDEFEKTSKDPRNYRGILGFNEYAYQEANIEDVISKQFAPAQTPTVERFEDEDGNFTARTKWNYDQAELKKGIMNSFNNGTVWNTVMLRVKNGTYKIKNDPNSAEGKEELANIISSSITPKEGKIISTYNMTKGERMDLDIKLQNLEHAKEINPKQVEQLEAAIENQKQIIEYRPKQFEQRERQIQYQREVGLANAQAKQDKKTEEDNIELGSQDWIKAYSKWMIQGQHWQKVGDSRTMNAKAIEDSGDYVIGPSPVLAMLMVKNMGASSANELVNYVDEEGKAKSKLMNLTSIQAFTNGQLKRLGEDTKDEGAVYNTNDGSVKISYTGEISDIKKLVNKIEETYGAVVITDSETGDMQGYIPVMYKGQRRRIDLFNTGTRHIDNKHDKTNSTTTEAKVITLNTFNYKFFDNYFVKR